MPAGMVDPVEPIPITELTEVATTLTATPVKITE